MEASENLTSHSKYKVVTGNSATELAVKENLFRSGEGTAVFVTFLNCPSESNLNGDYLQFIGKLKCSCGRSFPLKKTFTGLAAVASEIKPNRAMHRLRVRLMHQEVALIPGCVLLYGYSRGIGSARKQASTRTARSDLTVVAGLGGAGQTAWRDKILRP